MRISNIGKIQKIDTYKTNFNDMNDYDLDLNYNNIQNIIKSLLFNKGFKLNEDVYIIAITEWFRYSPKTNFKNINLLFKIYSNKLKTYDGWNVNPELSYKKRKMFVYSGDSSDLAMIEYYQLIK